MKRIIKSTLRIVIMLSVVFAAVLITTQWILPVVASIEAARKSPENSWLVSRELSDHSITTTKGTKLSYFGYQFEVPWSDIDTSQTRAYADSVSLTFRSGLRLIFGVSSKDSLKKESELLSPLTGHSDSDFETFDDLYRFTPGQMRLWAVSPRVHYRETLVVTMKSVLLSPEATTGFFYIANSKLKGFQQGDPQGWPLTYHPKSRSTVLLQLFSDDGHINFILSQKNYLDPAGISQGDINRIVASLRKIQE